MPLQDRAPSELIQHVFRWIHPTKVQQYRRVCRSVCLALRGSGFARLNLDTFMALGHVREPSTEGQDEHSEEDSGGDEASEWDDSEEVEQPPTSPKNGLHEHHRLVSLLHSHERMEATSLTPSHWDRALFHWPASFQRVYVIESLAPLSLRKVLWSKNLITGVLPPSISLLSTLSFLDLSHNHLSGPLPRSFGEFFSLEKLYLSSNQLTGELPSLANLIHLQVCDLSYNKFIGSLPDFPTSLEMLTLNNNKFTGSIPASLYSLHKLLFFKADNNKLSGAISGDIANLSRLLLLDLGNNKLRGQIPEEMGHGLRSLVKLYLHNNHFMGAIPDSFGDLMALEDVWLNGNSFSSSIPQRFFSLPHVTALRLDGNTRLAGGVPADVGRMQCLRYLNLSGCSALRGDLPVEIGACICLREVNVNGSGLVKRIPKGLEREGPVWKRLIRLGFQQE
ncbi:hypothetical protein BC830DRAFT_1105739 [Chytriomyces sp. MP71]|nr:hypothetical protein BC830DRAFT_1105739 [Chytriomyces sp. MP71]